MRIFDPRKHDFRPERGKGKPAAPRTDRFSVPDSPLDEALEETFPASDPPAVVSPSRAHRRS